MAKVPPPDYQQFVKEIKLKVHEAQCQALRAVNKNLIQLYWDIGQAIVEKQTQHGWGKAIVERLSRDLQNDLPGVKGFSTKNLWYMRQFYLTYQHNEKLQPLVGEISWSKHLVIIAKTKDDLEKEFYIKMTQKYGWSKSVLLHQVEGQAYERFLLNQTNFDQTIADVHKDQAQLAVKDSYSFDFLAMRELHTEREMELGLLKHIREFLLEMGGDFAFIGHQYKLEVGEDTFYIDLLLYHRQLRSLVAIELKTTAFKPEHAGQMQFYLTALDETVKADHEQPSIGIIICKDKNRTVVEYALKRTPTPIGVASYSISAELPEAMRQLLPSPEAIAHRLEGLIS